MRILLISLGGARYPYAPKLRHSSFAPSNMAISDLMAAKGLGMVHVEDHLDLFDQDGSWPDQLMTIRNWVKSRVDSEDNSVRLIVHYVGHGFFRPKSNQYFLTINRTDAVDRVETSATLADLSSVIKKHASRLRTYYLIDACFAASVIHDLQADGMEDAIRAKVSTALTADDVDTAGGIAALCSSSPLEASSAAGIAGLTQFTDGLVTILSAGDSEMPTALSLQRLSTLLRRTLDDRYGEEAISPVFHAPQGKAGGIGGLALFPNLYTLQVDSTFEEIEELQKEELRSRVEKFIDDLSAAKEELEQERKIDAIRVIGSSELHRVMNVGVRFRNHYFDVGQDFEQINMELSEVLQPLKGLRARLLPAYEFGRTRVRNSSILIASVKKIMASIKDDLLMQNATIDTDFQDAQDGRRRMLQMTFLAMEMQKKLVKRIVDAESIGVETNCLRRALEALQDRQSDLKHGMDRIVTKKVEMRSCRDENVRRIKRIDRIAIILGEIAQNLEVKLVIPLPVGRLQRIDRLLEISDLVERVRTALNEVASFSRSRP